jgi:hypothetical protein
MHMSIERLPLSDAELESELKRLATRERDATAALVRHLGEFGARRLFLRAGFSSLFKYCVVVLRLSEHAAFHRIVAARVIRRFPRVLGRLEDGSLTLTTVKLLAPHLTPENEAELVADAAGKGRRDVERILASRFPEREKRPVVRALPPTVVVAAPSRPESSAVLANPPSLSPAPAPAPPLRGIACAPPPQGMLRPVAEGRYRISFTASATTYENLQRARELLGHAVPSGDLDQVIGRALTLLVMDLSRRKFAATDRPRVGRTLNLDSRHIPADVRRVVWERDGGRCAFVAADGRRCDERRCLEFHHLWPWAENGKATPENIQLRCRAHNVYEAEVFYAASRAGRGTRPGPGSPVGWGGESRDVAGEGRSSVGGDRMGHGLGAGAAQAT